MVEQQMSIAIHYLRIGQAMTQLLSGDPKIEDECKKLLHCWKCGTIDPCDLSLQYQPAWYNCFDMLLSAAVARSMSPDNFLECLLKSFEIIVEHWTPVPSGANQAMCDYIKPIMMMILCGLRQSNPSVKCQIGQQKSDVELQSMLASSPLPKITTVHNIYFNNMGDILLPLTEAMHQMNDILIPWTHFINSVPLWNTLYYWL